MLEKGKKYLCLVCPYDNITEGKEYVAVDTDTIFDNYGVRVKVFDGECKFTEAKSSELPAKLIEQARSACTKKIVDAIFEFEKETGLSVGDIDFERNTQYGSTTMRLKILVSL